MKHLLSLFLIAFTSTLFAQSKPFEGVLHYTITQLNATGQKIENSESNAEVTIYVKGERLLMDIVQYIPTLGNVDTVETVFLQDFGTKDSYIGMKMIDNYYYTKDELEAYPAGKFNPSKIKSRTVQGLTCNAGVVLTADANTGLEQSATIWFTNHYSAPHLFFGQFVNVPGMVVSVEEKSSDNESTLIELSKMEAKSISEAELQMPKKYTFTTWEELFNRYPMLNEGMELNEN